MLYLRQHKKNGGFSLVEVLIGTALFVLIAVAVYQSYATLTTLISVARLKVTATDLVNERLELIRNLPFNQVGEVGGIPSGVLNHVDTFVRDNNTFIATTTIRNIDDPFDGTLGGTPNDTAPADYKMVEVDINCKSCKNFPPMSVVTQVAPKNLETASTNGALFIKAFDANGIPIQDANVHVVNSKATSTITIDDVTNAQGLLQIVDAPPGVNAYQITVSKTGYSTDQTYATSSGNPNPTKLASTVAVQQVTQASFAIDKVSAMSLSAVTETCAPVGGLTLNMQGNKVIGTTPNVYKYNQNLTLDAGGLKTVSNLEWDTYNISLTSAGYYLAGVNPLLPVTILPNSNQNVQLVVTTGPASVLLVTVKDNASGLPISGATVTLTKTGYSNALITGRGFLGQTDWSGGSGQTTFTDATKYASSDGNVDVSSPAGDLKLNSTFGIYAPSGNLTSSTFDTGTTSNFNQINWNPLSEPAQVGTPNVRFQVAANNDSTTWNFSGPDGTASTYYTTANTNLSSVYNGNEFFRYKAYLDTASTTYTSDISDVALTFTSGCVPPGQVDFTGLSNATYNISVSAPGYTTYSGSAVVSGSWQSLQVPLSP